MADEVRNAGMLAAISAALGEQEPVEKFDFDGVFGSLPEPMLKLLQEVLFARDTLIERYGIQGLCKMMSDRQREERIIEGRAKHGVRGLCWLPQVPLDAEAVIDILVRVQKKIPELDLSEFLLGKHGQRGLAVAEGGKKGFATAHGEADEQRERDLGRVTAFQEALQADANMGAWAACNAAARVLKKQNPARKETADNVRNAILRLSGCRTLTEYMSERHQARQK